MSIYHINDKQLQAIQQTSFNNEGLYERRDIQHLLKENISALGNDLLVIAEEYGEFDESNRRIDLLAIDKGANFVVIELKRTLDGGHMELQAIRYAAMIANMTWDDAVAAFNNYLDDEENTAEEQLLQFLSWDEPHRDDLGAQTRIILASADFSKEITTTVLWLNDLELDITCVRLSLYKLNNELLLNAEQIIPLPETESYQVAVRKKKRDVRQAQASSRDRSTYTLQVNNKAFAKNFKKSDIGYNMVKALEANELIDSKAFDFLREDKSCRFMLLKKLEEITDGEKQYSKYRYQKPPEFSFDDVGYFIARNWGINNIDNFITKMTERFPEIKVNKD